MSNNVFHHFLMIILVITSTVQHGENLSNQDQLKESMYTQVYPWDNSGWEKCCSRYLFVLSSPGANRSSRWNLSGACLGSVVWVLADEVIAQGRGRVISALSAGIGYHFAPVTRPYFNPCPATALLYKIPDVPLIHGKYGKFPPPFLTFFFLKADQALGTVADGNE